MRDHLSATRLKDLGFNPKDRRRRLLIEELVKALREVQYIHLLSEKHICCPIILCWQLDSSAVWCECALHSFLHKRQGWDISRYLMLGNKASSHDGDTSLWKKARIHICCSRNILTCEKTREHYVCRCVQLSIYSNWLFLWRKSLAFAPKLGTSGENVHHIGSKG